MFLFDSEARLLKNLNGILMRDIPAVAHNRAIMEPLKSHSGLDRKDLVKALAHGQAPRIKVTQIDTIPWALFLNGTAKEMGFTPNNSATTGIIELERDLVRFLEAPLPPKHTPVAKPPLASALQELRTFVRNTLLHELVHFGNNLSGKVPRAGVEMGDRFEIAAGLSRRFPLFFLKPQAIEDTPVPIIMHRNPDDPLRKLLE